jgi:hypothetical protein
MFGIDPLLGTILTAGGIFVVSYLINRQHFESRYEDVIEATVDHLIKDGYVATRRDKDGDIELIPIKELHNVDL